MIVNRENRSLVFWLYSISFMVLCMVLIGGITRLTDSGLSMVDWKPIMGIIPPLNEAEWLSAFQKYQAFPEYKLINSNKGMDLNGFKAIFFWEYFHRLFGRLIGLVFIIPYIYFLIRKKIPKNFKRKLIIAFVLGGLQGLMGWYMVKSGLVNEPDVSHYRLAAHLSLAFIIIAYIYWIVLSLKFQNYRFVSLLKDKKVFFFGLLLCIQIVFGALVAGLDAGLTHNTFPKMGRVWVPESVFSFVNLDDYLHNKVAVQFIHRCFAWLLLFSGLVLFFKRKSLSDFMHQKARVMVFATLCLQFLLGVMTLLMYVPISIASMHQVVACILLLAYVRMIYFSSCQKII